MRQVSDDTVMSRPDSARRLMLWLMFRDRALDRNEQTLLTRLRRLLPATSPQLVRARG